MADADLGLSGVEMSARLLQRLERNVRSVIVGKDEVVRLALVALAAGGHLLLEDLPGTGKTMLARSLAESVGGSFRRIQGTADLLPSDITGVSVFNQRDLSFEFRPGPVFAHVVLADELNRATPRAQSALLEAMAEGQVTLEGTTRRLHRPFLVIATQNPLEMHGTYPLPDSQLDRFLIATRMGPTTPEQTMEVLERREHGDPMATLEAVLSPEEVLALQAEVLRVGVSPALREYLVLLLETLRGLERVLVPPSTRAILALQRACQAWALFDQRDYVLPDDVKALAGAVLGHRIGLRGEEGGAETVARVLEQIPLPALGRP
ncbi:MAG TPA: MoxR family ATPase [Candidatus Nitrosotalea sp.]|nr:MoxR family ATPase [Candidatus Nitrosotalea sp.]